MLSESETLETADGFKLKSSRERLSYLIAVEYAKCIPPKANAVPLLTTLKKRKFPRKQ